jgi:hypothetical protein
MYKGRRIRYNRKMVEFFILHNQFDALAIFYLLKIIHSNSIIYKLENADQLFTRLKKEKALPSNFSKKRFLEAMWFLDRYRYVFQLSNGNIGIKKITSGIGYYKSKIEYNRKNINFNIVQRLLLKEELLYTKNRQEKAMTFRAEMTTHTNKAKNSMRKLSTLNAMGESYSNQVSFTYRNIAKKLGKSLTWVKESIDWIRSNTNLSIHKITECKHYVGKNVDFSEVKNRLYPNCYAYLTSSGNVVAILGSSITTIK